VQSGTEDNMGSGPKSSSSNNDGGSSSNSDGVDETADFVNGKGKFTVSPEIFEFTSSIPERSYSYEALLSTILPGSIGGLIGIVLIALLWADREDESVYSNGNGAATYSYHQIARQQHQDESRQTREATLKPEPEAPRIIHGAAAEEMPMAMDEDMMAPPIMPPLYSETHPNGAPAMIYAV
jgi:hypothetical protein